MSRRARSRARSRTRAWGMGSLLQGPVEPPSVRRTAPLAEFAASRRRTWGREAASCRRPRRSPGAAATPPDAWATAATRSPRGVRSAAGRRRAARRAGCGGGEVRTIMLDMGSMATTALRPASSIGPPPTPRASAGSAARMRSPLAPAARAGRHAGVPGPPAERRRGVRRKAPAPSADAAASPCPEAAPLYAACTGRRGGIRGGDMPR